jgi:DNA repair protein RecO (recombination protein O)
MLPVKTRALILRADPYRESSYLASLLTESNGLVRGIAKGLRGKSRFNQFLERGLLVETTVYVKPERDLFTIGAVSVLDFFPSTRSSLVKSGTRDAAFELLLSALKVSDPHPELFAFVLTFLEANETRESDIVYPWLLWRFYVKLSAMMGFALNFFVCARCGRAIEEPVAFLNAARGGVECKDCSGKAKESYGVSKAVREFLGGAGGIGSEVRKIGNIEKRNVTRLLDIFCRFHFEIKQESKALAFLESLDR